MVYAIIKDNYVIARVVGEEGYVYPRPHDIQVEDPEGYIYVGDWYEEVEDIFYRPINGTPPDLPDEIKPTNENE